MMVPKFRAWDETQHKMLQVDCIDFIDGKAYWVEASPADGNVQGGNDGPVGGNNRLKLEQSTGLKDANGKEIYVGDIVKYHNLDDKYQYLPIIWLDQDCLVSAGGYRIDIVARRCEVIGNIHENPGLLEAQHG